MHKFSLKEIGKVDQRYDSPKLLLQKLLLQKEYLPALSGLKDLVIFLSYDGLINWIAKKYAALKC